MSVRIDLWLKGTALHLILFPSHFIDMKIQFLPLVFLVQSVKDVNLLLLSNGGYHIIFILLLSLLVFGLYHLPLHKFI